MNCADSRHLIHLDAGGDLPAEDEQRLAGHMESCAECRAYSAGMVRAMSALHVLRDFAPASVVVASAGAVPSAVSSSAGRKRYAAADSAWPAIASRLPVRSRAVRSLRQFNARVVGLCVCSLALAVVTIVQNLPVSRVPSAEFIGSGQLTSMQNGMTPRMHYGQRFPAFAPGASDGTAVSGDNVQRGVSGHTIQPAGSASGNFLIIPSRPLPALPAASADAHSL